MSVQSEITRLENAKAAIKAAIEGKGVTVPDATLLDGMAPLIESIEAGGGGNITAGTITALNYKAQKVEHGLGAVPQAVIFFAAAKPTVILTNYDDAPIGHIITGKGSASVNWFYLRGLLNVRTLSASDTDNLWGTGSTNLKYDRINNINNVYFMTPENCDACTYLWVAFKEPLV